MWLANTAVAAASSKGSCQCSRNRIVNPIGQMEFFWCLRWLEQERITETTAFVLRENLVRFEHAPIYTRIADLPPAAPGAHVRVQVSAIDLFAATLECRSAGLAGDDVAADPADLELAGPDGLGGLNGSANAYQEGQASVS